MAQFARQRNGNGSAPSAQPSQAERLGVFTIIERENAKPFWRPIGSAFQNRDGSLNIYLDALPVNGRLNVRRRDQGGDENRDGSHETYRD